MRAAIDSLEAVLVSSSRSRRLAEMAVAEATEQREACAELLRRATATALTQAQEIERLRADGVTDLAYGWRWEPGRWVPIDDLAKPDAAGAHPTEHAPPAGDADGAPAKA